MILRSKDPEMVMLRGSQLALGAMLMVFALVWGGGMVAHAAKKPLLEVRVAYLTRAYDEPPPLSLLDKILTDKGVPGARLALKEIWTIGTLLGHDYHLDVHIVPKNEDFVLKAKEIFASGIKLIIADLEAEDLLLVADLPEAKDAVLLNIRDSGDKLRQEECRANAFHIIPSQSMRADALGQYLIWKRWDRWFLIRGKTAKDVGYAKAVRRAAGRYGAKIVGEKSYEFQAGHRRVDSGHQQIQTQMPKLTQEAPEHDVVFVADAAEAFGEYLQFRTYIPRPVVGTHGLIAVAWHRSFEQYAGMQMQTRFEKFAGRTMIERDYTAWLAMRIFGEAVTRTGQSDAGKLREYILSDKFRIAGFKGRGMTFRGWNNQLRQPVLLTGPRALVSVSPQEGFLHPKFLTDTLGFDEPETKCKFSQ